MIAAGWRKPARVSAGTKRGAILLRPVVGTAVEELRPALHRRTPWWKRLWALIASGAMAVALGATIATTVGFGAAWLIITLSDMLKR